MRLGVAILSAGAVLVATPAAANICLKTQAMYDHLRTQYGETPAFIAVERNGGVLVLVLSDKGTFTVIIQPTADVSCSVSSGDSWAPAPDNLRHPPKPETKS